MGKDVVAPTAPNQGEAKRRNEVREIPETDIVQGAGGKAAEERFASHRVGPLVFEVAGRGFAGGGVGGGGGAGYGAGDGAVD